MTNPNSPSVWRARTVDALFTVSTSALALTGFGAIFGGHAYLLFGLAGIGVAVLVAVATSRLPVLLAVALGIVAFVWVGALMVFPHSTIGIVLPDPEAIKAVGAAAVHGWRDLVTTLPPVVGRDLVIIPYLCGLVGALVGLLLSWRTRTVTLPLVGPAALLIAVILLGTSASVSVLVNGVFFGVAALAWSAFRYRRNRPVAEHGTGWSAGLLRAVALLAIVGLAMGGLSLTSFGTGHPRYVLRDHVQPPFDPSAYPSPLSSFRKFEVSEKKTVLFTVSGLPTGARIQLAVMDSYDGVVWGVTGGPGSTEASGVFQRVGDPIATTVSGRKATVTVTTSAFAGVWMPTVGRLTSVRFDGSRAAALASSFRYNRTTGVAVIPAMLSPTDRYTMTVVVPDVPAATSLLNNALGSATLPDLTGVADQVPVRAQEWTDGVTAPVDRLQKITALMRAGAFSDGSIDSGVTSPPGAGQRRIETFLSARQLVGDGEQYASALALIARDLGMPARVVLGVVPPVGFTGSVTGSMVSAWVEVDIAGAGWVPFDPTPPVTNKPRPQLTPKVPDTRTRVVTPPIAIVQAVDEQPADSGMTRPPIPVGMFTHWLTLLLMVGEYGGFEALAVIAFLLTVVWIKRVRRRRRRNRGTPLLQIVGGWRELLDRIRDLGVATPTVGTRRQRAVATAYPQIETFAHRVDEAVFAPGEPNADTVRQLWDDIDAYLVRLARTRSRAQRVRGAVSLLTFRPAALRRLRRPIWQFPMARRTTPMAGGRS